MNDFFHGPEAGRRYLIKGIDGGKIAKLSFLLSLFDAKLSVKKNLTSKTTLKVWLRNPDLSMKYLSKLVRHGLKYIGK
jgi:hypothetical protein